MHGIIRKRNLKEGTESNSTNIRRIEVRYTGGATMTFVAEAGREVFGNDDKTQISQLLDKTAEVIEWAEVSEQYTE